MFKKNYVYSLLMILVATFISSILISAVLFSKYDLKLALNAATYLPIPFRITGFLILLVFFYLCSQTKFFKVHQRTIKIILLVSALCFQILFLLFCYRSLYMNTAYMSYMISNLLEGNQNWFGYFSVFPQNLDATLFLTLVLKPFYFLGMNNNLLIMSWLQMVILDLGLFYFWYSLNKVKPKIADIYFYSILFYFPLFTYTILPYNDIFAFVLILIALGQLLRLTAHKLNRKSFIISSTILAVSITLATVIRETYLIALIALILSVFLLKQWNLKKKVFLVLELIIIMFGITALFNLAADNQNFKQVPNFVTPKMSYINMSWNPNTSGQMDGTDSYAYHELPTAERNEQLKKSIKHRLKIMGPKGIFVHLVKKDVYMFSLGASNEDMWPFHVVAPFIHSANQSLDLQQILVSVFQPYYILILVLSLWGLYKIHKDKALLNSKLSAIYLFSIISFIGFFVFHVALWEVRDRYVMQSLPFLLIFSSVGMLAFTEGKQLNLDKIVPKFIKVVVPLLVILLTFSFFNMKKGTAHSANTNAPVYVSGIFLFREDFNIMEPIKAHTEYETKSFEIKNNANQFILPLDSDDINGIKNVEITVQNTDSGKTFKYNGQRGSAVYWGNFEKGHYKVKINNPGDMNLYTVTMENVQTDNLIGPKVKRNGQLVHGLNMNFKFFNAATQRYLTKKALLIIYLPYALLTLTLLIIVIQKVYRKGKK